MIGLISMIFFSSSAITVSNGWNFMKLILIIYDLFVVMQISSGCNHLKRSYCPLIAYILMIFSILSHNIVSNGWNFTNPILSIYDHSVVIHMKFCQDILGKRGVIALWFSNC